MSSELSFLIELLLKHKLPQKTKDLVADRIKSVEENLSYRPAPVQSFRQVNPIPVIGGSPQAPSTMAILAKNPDLAAAMTGAHKAMEEIASPPPVEVIAQTPQTAAALASRQAMIAQAMSGKPEAGRTSPPKLGGRK